MAIRPLTLTTAAALSLAFALQTDAGQANVSLATGSAVPPATTALATTAPVTEAATTAAASMVLEAQTPQAAPAPDPEPAPSVTGGVNVDLFSHYVWRGFVLTDGFAFQPSVFVSTRGLTFTSWSSWSSTDAGCFPGDCPSLREHDFTVDYTRPIGTATLSVGYINYLFPPARTDEAEALGGVGSTNEIYGGVTFAAPANPFVKLYVDVDGDDDEGDTSRGSYLQFGVSHPIPVAEGRATLTPMFAVGYNFKQWIADNDWNDANLGVKLAIPFGKITITPAAYLSIGLNDSVRAIGYGDDPADPARAKFYGGVGFSYAF